MVGIFDCGGVLGKYEIRLKERKVVNMEALNTYKTEKTLAEQMNERLAEMKMTKAEAALKMNYSRAALSQYLNGKYASDPTELALLVKDIQDSHIIRVILDVNLPPDIVTKLIRAVLISPLGNANVTDKHVL